MRIKKEKNGKNDREGWEEGVSRIRRMGSMRGKRIEKMIIKKVKDGMMRMKNIKSKRELWVGLHMYRKIREKDKNDGKNEIEVWKG